MEIVLIRFQNTVPKILPPPPPYGHFPGPRVGSQNELKAVQNTPTHNFEMAKIRFFHRIVI